MLIRHKAYAGAISIALGIVLTIGVFVYALQRVDYEMREDALAIEISRHVFQLSLVTRDYTRYKSARARAQWQAKHKELTSALQASKGMATDAHEETHIARLYEGADVMADLFARLVKRDEMLDLPAASPSDFKNYQSLLEAGFALRSEIMLADANELSALSKRQAHRVRSTALTMTAASLVLLCLVAISFALTLMRRMLRAAAALKDGADAFAAGDSDYTIPLHGNDEMTVVARAFNNMTERVRQAQVGLEAANASLRSEIEVRAVAESRLQASEEQFRSLAQSANDGIISCGADGTIVYGNGSANRMFGYPEGMSGMPIEAIMPVRFSATHESGMKMLSSGEKSGSLTRRTVELVGLRSDKTEFPVDLSLAEWITSEGRFFTGVVRDITDRKLTEARLFQEKELAQITLASIADAVVTTDATGTIQFVNAVASELTGWGQNEASGRRFGQVFRTVGGSGGGALQDPVETVLATGQAYCGARDAVLLARAGAEHLIEISAAPILTRDGQTAGVVVVCHNVTETRALNAQLVHQASHDALTGLFNRTYFERVLTDALAYTRSVAGFSTLLYLDLDQFKVINDSCSHSAGDELLRQVAQLVQTTARKSDTVARLGGDEFSILLVDCEVEDAQRIALGLVKALQEFRFSWHDKIFSVTASIGLVGIDADSVDQASVLIAADTACFIAKDRGRNQIAVFEPQNADVIRRHGEMNWVSRITRGLQEHRFVLYYQKIAHVVRTDQQGEHYELLLRLRDDDGRLVPPMAFIPAAERYNLMPAVDRWVIATFFEYAARRPNAARGDTFAINLSGTSINDPSFLAYVTMQFERTGASPHSICFEITETAAIANLTRATAFMTELKKMGCRFSLDDFGSGLSSFGYLKNLPVDYLKIDGSFVKGILSDRVDRAMVDAINRVGHIIGIQTIAEFVDNDKVLEELRAIGVDFAQGYGIHQPQELELAAAKSIVAACASASVHR